MTKKKNQVRNAIWGLIATITDIACGLYTSRLLLNTFGANAHGLINAINNILSIVISVEFTFLVFWHGNYYRSFEKDDINQLSNIYHRDKRASSHILTVAFVSTLIIAFVYPLYYLDQFSYFDTAILVFALGIYILTRYGTIVNVGFLNSDYHNYVVKILATCTTILTTLSVFLLTKFGFSLRDVKITVAAILLIHPIFYYFYIHKHYKLPKPTEKLPLLKMPRTHLFRNIFRIVLNSRVDILILTIIAPLSDISIYAIYAMVGSYLTYAINSMFDGRDAVYGHAFAKNDLATVKKAYARTQFCLANVLAIVFGIAIMMLNPFVRLYTKFVKGINYNLFWFGLFMLIAQLFSCIRVSQNKLVYASEIIKDKNLLVDTILEALINLVVSIILFYPMGLVGIAIGTALSHAYTVLHCFNYRRKYIMKTSIWHAIRRYIPTIIIISLTTFSAFAYPWHPKDKFEWLNDAVITSLILIPLTFILNLIFNPNFRKHVWRFTKKCFRATNKNTNKFLRLSHCQFKNIFVKIHTFLKSSCKKIGYGFKAVFIGIRYGFNFGFKALGAMRQRGPINAIRIFFRHKKAVAFEQSNPNMDDVTYLTQMGKILLGKKLNLNNPQTLNEKINWLKIYGQREIYTIMSDKAAVKDFVAKKLGSNYIIPTYGVWDHFDDINWDSLPDAFVLKCTHDSGSIYLVTDKTKLNLADARRHFEKRLNTAYWRKTRENGYQFISPRIIAEQYMSGLGHRNSVEYKFTCFNGKVVFGTICQGYGHGFNKRRVNDFYTPDFQHLHMRAWYHNAHHRPKKPAQWEEMIAISEKFAQDIPYLRVDLYVENEQIYFGEFTFYTGGGFIEFHPKKTDLILGQQLTLPSPTTPPQHPSNQK